MILPDITISNLPKHSYHSLVFPIEKQITRIHLIPIKDFMGLDNSFSYFVFEWKCWYLNGDDYRAVKYAKGDIAIIKKVFARTKQILLD